MKQRAFHKKYILVLFVFISVFNLLLLQSCGNKNKIYTKNKTIKIGIIAPITGDEDSIGVQEIMSLRYANEKYDRVKIGDEEYKIQIVEKDHNSNIKKAKNVANDLVKENVSFVICGYNENVINEAKEVFVKEKIPFVISSGISTELTNGDEYSFKISQNDIFLAPAIVNYLKNIGKSSLAIISEKDDIKNDGMIYYMERAANSLGVDIVKKIGISNDDFYDNDYLSDLKSQDIECIYIDVSKPYLASVIKNIREYGIKTKIITTDLIEYELDSNDLQTYLEDIDYFTSFDENTLRTKVAKEFVEGIDKKGFNNYLLANGEKSGVHSQGALAYDSFLAIYNALLSSLSTDKSDILQSLSNVSFEATNGIVNFWEDKNTNIKLVYIKNIKNGIANIVDEINLNAK